MSNTVATVTSADLSLMGQSDAITLDSLPTYVRAVQESVKGDNRITYGRTLVYRAAAALGFMYQTDDKGETVRHNGEPVIIYGEKFVAKDYADHVGVSPAMVSTWALLSLAVDRGISPESKSEKDAERFAAIVQNATSAVRKVLRDKKSTRTALDAVLFPKALAKKESRKENAKKSEGEESGETRAPRNGDGPEVGALDAFRDAAKSLVVAKLTASEMAELETILTSVRARLDALAAPVPPKQVRKPSTRKPAKASA